jgi:hypothetical protein
MARGFDPSFSNVFGVRQAAYDASESPLRIDRWGPSRPGEAPPPFRTFEISRATADDKCPRSFYECPSGTKTTHFSGYAASIPRID